MEGFLIAAIVVLVVFFGIIAGYIALFSVFAVKKRVSELEYHIARITHLENDVDQLSRMIKQVSSIESQPDESVVPETSIEPDTPAIVETPPTESPPEQPEPQPAVQPKPVSPAISTTVSDSVSQTPKIPIEQSAQEKESVSLELVLGSKWLNWIGIVLVIFSVAFFLKYAIDKNWITPLTRVLLGTIVGMGCIGLGEYTRRTNYPILFQSLTGGGLAIFYICIYFSFQVYQFIDPGIAFFLSIIVTFLAITISVMHNAQPLCIFGQIGGFLSPFLFSSGESNAILLFSYIFILNFIAIGSTWYKGWKAVIGVSFIGTFLLYGIWRLSTGSDESLMNTALIFSILFYLQFIISPMIHSWLHRKPAEVLSLQYIVTSNIAILINHYTLFIDFSRSLVSITILIQSFFILGLFFVWKDRCKDDTKTQSSLLAISISLVAFVIPVYFERFAIAIGWAIQAVVLYYIGLQYNRRIMQVFTMILLVLSAGKLFSLLPLHQDAFIPVFNSTFAVWLLVIAANLGTYSLSRINQISQSNDWKTVDKLPLIIGSFLGCILITFEAINYWTVQDLNMREILLYSSTTVCIEWTVILLIFAELLPKIHYKVAVSFISIAFILAGLSSIVMVAVWPTMPLPFFHIQFFTTAALAFITLYSASEIRTFNNDQWQLKPLFTNGFEIVGHTLIVIVVAVDISFWFDSLVDYSRYHKHGVISLLWSLQALTAIYLGLLTRIQLRRIIGFTIFAITVIKVFLLDMIGIEPVYRILSFAASGIILIIAGYIYQYYSKKLLDESNIEASEDE
jgi:uncharacterized membrane protein